MLQRVSKEKVIGWKLIKLFNNVVTHRAAVNSAVTEMYLQVLRVCEKFSSKPKLPSDFYRVKWPGSLQDNCKFV